MSQLFAAVLRARMSAVYLANIDIARELGVAPQLVRRWASAQGTPATEDLPTLARVLGLTEAHVTDLVGPTSSVEAAPRLPLSAIERAARDHWAKLHALPPAFRQTVLVAQLRANGVESGEL